MIYVSDSIKALLHQDTCPKNIRISFPNGERGDICNDMIVKDSVSLHESLCSRNNFTFGLAESPIFECETVGVENIKNCEIQVDCEIYVNASEPGASWRADIQQWVYPIAYGRFKVTSCERQADMQHRKILCYNALATNGWSLSPFEISKTEVMLSNNTPYKPSFFHFLLTNTQNYEIENEFFERTDDVAGSSTTVFGTNVTWENDGKTYVAEVYPSCKEYSISKSDSHLSNSILKIVPAYNSIGGSWENELYTLLEKYKCPYKIIKELFTKIGVKYSFANVGGADGAVGLYDPLNVVDKTVIVYPWIDGFYSESNEGYHVMLHNSMSITIKEDGQTVETQGITTSPYSGMWQQVYWEKLKNDYSALLNVKLTFNRYKFESGGTNYRLSFEGANVQDYINAYCAIRGQFGMFDEGGALTFRDIKEQFNLLPSTSLYPGTSLTPEGVTGGSILPQDYQTCWYDDDYKLPYGMVQVEYVDNYGTEQIKRHFLDGYNENTDARTYQVYYVSKNVALESPVWTNAMIEMVCEWIADAIDGVTYMPVKLVGRGLPYVKPGDTFEILTSSGDSIITIVLERTLKGEMNLVDEYLSVG